MGRGVKGEVQGQGWGRQLTVSLGARVGKPRRYVKVSWPEAGDPAQVTIKSGAEAVPRRPEALSTLGHSGRHVLQPQAKPTAAESLAQF